MERGARTQEATVSDLGGGVLRVTQPLPWALDHVHCYALSSADGWTIVDCGLGTPGTLERWRAALGELGGAVRRIVVTHYHPDHLGSAAALAELTGAAEIVQGALDAELAEAAWGEGADVASFETFLRAYGMPEELAAASASEEVRLAGANGASDGPRRGRRPAGGGRDVRGAAPPGPRRRAHRSPRPRDRTPARRRRPARGDHAERRALGGHGLRSARTLPRDAVAGSRDWLHPSSTRAMARRSRTLPAGRARSGSTTRSGWT